MEANQSGATSVDGASKRLSTFLTDEREPTEVEDVEPQEVAQTEVEQPDTETPTGDTEVEVERYTVKVGDEEQSVTLDDLRKGYMMESDYRKKTSEVSERRKALDSKEAEIDAQLNEAQALIEFEMQNLESPEMVELKEVDPEAYLKEFDRVNKKVDAFNKAKAKRQEDQDAKATERAAKEREALLAAIPAWIDPEVMNKEANDVFAYLETAGYSKEELSAISDHRSFVTARKAMLFDQISTKDLEAKKVKTPPKTVKPAASQSNRDDPKVKDLRSKLHKTGKVQDAAALLRAT